METLEDGTHMQLLLGFSPVPAETTADLSGCPEPAQGVHGWILSPMGRTSAHTLLLEGGLKRRLPQLQGRASTSHPS